MAGSGSLKVVVDTNNRDPLSYRPHLPFPESYRVVGLGAVELGAPPQNPHGGEQVVTVEHAPLATVVDHFVSAKRLDLAELYQFAADHCFPHPTRDADI